MWLGQAPSPGEGGLEGNRVEADDRAVLAKAKQVEGRGCDSSTGALEMDLVELPAPWDGREGETNRALWCWATVTGGCGAAQKEEPVRNPEPDRGREGEELGGSGTWFWESGAQQGRDQGETERESESKSESKSESESEREREQAKVDRTPDWVHESPFFTWLWARSSNQGGGGVPERLDQY